MAGVAIAGPFEDGAAAYQRGDYEAAYLRWHSIAENGDRNAQYNIARLYYQGKGVPQDLGEAARWYRRAASRGEPYAQFFLGVMLANGKGMPQDLVEAYKWYDIAASRFSPTDAKNRDEIIKRRDAMAADMTPAQIAEAQKQVGAWKPEVTKP